MKLAVKSPLVWLLASCFACPTFSQQKVQASIRPYEGGLGNIRVLSPQVLAFDDSYYQNFFTSTDGLNFTNTWNWNFRDCALQGDQHFCVDTNLTIFRGNPGNSPIRKSTPASISNRPIRILSLSPNFLILAFPSSIYVSIDGGNTFQMTRVDSLMMNPYASGMDPVSARIESLEWNGTTLFAFNGYGIWTSQDTAKTWIRTSFPRLSTQDRDFILPMSVTSQGVLYELSDPFAGAASRFFLSRDQGMTWQPYLKPLTFGVNSMAIVGADTVIGTQKGAYLWQGGEWVSFSAPIQKDFPTQVITFKNQIRILQSGYLYTWEKPDRFTPSTLTKGVNANQPVGFDGENAFFGAWASKQGQPFFKAKVSDPGSLPESGVSKLMLSPKGEVLSLFPLSRWNNTNSRWEAMPYPLDRTTYDIELLGEIAVRLARGLFPKYETTEGSMVTSPLEIANPNDPAWTDVRSNFPESGDTLRYQVCDPYLIKRSLHKPSRQYSYFRSDDLGRTWQIMSSFDPLFPYEFRSIGGSWYAFGNLQTDSTGAPMLSAETVWKSDDWGGHWKKASQGIEKSIVYDIQPFGKSAVALARKPDSPQKAYVLAGEQWSLVSEPKISNWNGITNSIGPNAVLYYNSGHDLYVKDSIYWVTPLEMPVRVSGPRRQRHESVSRGQGSLLRNRTWKDPKWILGRRVAK